MSSIPRANHLPNLSRQWAHALEVVPPASVARVSLRIISVIALFFLAAALGLGLYGYTHADRVYQGVTVAGVQVGGMTGSEARIAVQRSYDEYLRQPVTLTYEGESFTVVPANSGISLDSASSVDQAMLFGRDGSIWNRTQSWARALLRGKDVPAVLIVDQDRLDRTLTKIAPNITLAPSNAYIKLSSGEPEIIGEKPGVAFDLGTTSHSLLSHVSSLESNSVAIAAPALDPSVKKEDLVEQLAAVQTTVGTALILSGVDQYWAVKQDDLKRIVSVPGPGQPVEINEVAIRELVRGIAGSIEHPAIDASLIVNDRGELQVIPSDASVDVNINASVNAIVAALEAGTHDVPLSIKREQPAISDQQAQDALLKADQLVADGLTLTWKNGSAEFGRQDLIAAIKVDYHPGESEAISLGFSPEVIGILLGPVAEMINIEAVNGRYRYSSGEVKLVEKGSNGLSVDIDKSTDAVIEAIMGGTGLAPLTVKTVKPEFTTANAEKIKLDDVLGTAYTYYGNSSEARRLNVERAVALESGWLVAPGDVFSYYEFIGKVDEKNGFVTGLGILSDGEGGITTAPVVGGGICQVSTTIFQSAFWAGLTIVDRTQHPYWLQNYGQPPTGMKGLDAMVNIENDPAESLDLQFRNNTGNWIAVVITADGENVTSQIMGTDPGWTVTVQGNEPKISKLVNPPIEVIYQDSPELPKGEEKQVETAQQGFDATIVRITKDRDGNVIDEYTLTSTYVPSVNRVLRGTGTGG